MSKRTEFIQEMKESMVDMDKEGNEIKFFSSKFLVQKYLHLSDADIKLNQKYKREEIEELNLAGGEDGEEEGGGFESMKREIATLRRMITEKLDNHPGKPVDDDETDPDGKPVGKKTKKKTEKKPKSEEE